MRGIWNAPWAVIVGLLVAWCSIFGGASSTGASQPGTTDATSLAAGSQGSAEEQFRFRLEEQVCPEAARLAWAMEGGKGTQGLTREAATLENILQGMPTPDPGLSWRLAVAYRALGEHAKAIQVLERFRASCGYIPLKFAELAALCLRAQGNPEGAAAWLDQADSPAGLPPAACAYLGLLKSEAGRSNEAIQAFEAAVAAEPNDLDLYAALGKEYEKAGIGGVKVFVGGKIPAFDVKPFIRDNRTLVPIRAIAEALGAEVKWDAVTQVVTILRSGKRVALRIGDAQAEADGRAVKLDVPAQIVDNRTVVPLRFVSEGLGAEVKWFGQGQVAAVLEGIPRVRLALWRDVPGTDMIEPALVYRLGDKPLVGVTSDRECQVQFEVVREGQLVLKQDEVPPFDAGPDEQLIQLPVDLEPGVYAIRALVAGRVAAQAQIEVVTDAGPRFALLRVAGGASDDMLAPASEFQRGDWLVLASSPTGPITASWRVLSRGQAVAGWSGVWHISPGQSQLRQEVWLNPGEYMLEVTVNNQVVAVLPFAVK